MPPRRRERTEEEGKDEGRSSKRVRFDPHETRDDDFDEEQGFQTRRIRERNAIVALKEAEDRAASESDDDEDDETRAKTMRKVKTDQYDDGRKFGDGSKGEGTFTLDSSGRVAEVEGEEELQVDHGYDDSEQQFEPFNLKDEMRSGYFDGSGNYIENSSKGVDEDDPWLHQLDDSAGKKRESSLADTVAALNPTKDEKDLMMREQEMIDQENVAGEAHDPRLHLEALIKLLEPGETPLNALRRWKEYCKSEHGTKKGDLSAEEKQRKVEGTSAMDAVTEACEVLLGGGYYGIYEDNREKFEGLINKWEIRWNDKSEVHGPFTQTQMRDWKANGYFVEANKPIIRCNGGDWKEGWNVEF